MGRGSAFVFPPIDRYYFEISVFVIFPAKLEIRRNAASGRLAITIFYFCSEGNIL